MRTTYPLIVVLALGVTSMMWGMSGIGDVYDQDVNSGLESDDELQEVANDSAAKGSTADAGPNQGGNIVGLIFSGLQRFTSIAGLVVLLPYELHNLGFPWWFALPIGLIAQTIVGIGLIEFSTNREWT